MDDLRLVTNVTFLGPAIPRQVAPQQSLTPLHRTNNNITNKNISVIRDRIGVTKQHYSHHAKTAEESVPNAASPARPTTPLRTIAGGSSCPFGRFPFTLCTECGESPVRSTAL